MVSLEFRLSSTTNLACLGILIEGSKVYQIITEMWEYSNQEDGTLIENKKNIRNNNTAHKNERVLTCT